jgi:hypothetical protein
MHTATFLCHRLQIETAPAATLCQTSHTSIACCSISVTYWAANCACMLVRATIVRCAHLLMQWSRHHAQPNATHLALCAERGCCLVCSPHNSTARQASLHLCIYRGVLIGAQLAQFCCQVSSTAPVRLLCSMHRLGSCFTSAVQTQLEDRGR